MRRKNTWIFLGAVPILTSGCGIANAAATNGAATVALGPVQHATRVVGTDPRIAVSGGAVDVAITSAPGKTLSVRYHLPRHGHVRIVHHGTWIIRVTIPQNIHRFSNAYLAVRVPTSTSLHAAASTGNVHAQGTYRRVWIASDVGSVSSTQLTTRSLVAESHAADVSVSWSKAPVAVKLQSNTGNITVTGPWAAACVISSDSGNVRVTGHPTVRTAVQLTSGVGNISSQFSAIASSHSLNTHIRATIGPVSTPTSGTLVVHTATGNIAINS